MPELKEWMGRSSYKWLLHDIQNEIIDILGKSVLRSVVCEIKWREHFAIMVDKTCDISIHEQVTCIRSVNENLTKSEDFVGLYETPNTEGKTLFGIMKDILARLDLNTENMRGQRYDSTSAMSGKFKWLQKFVANLQPKRATAALKTTYPKEANPCATEPHDIFFIRKDSFRQEYVCVL
ncbi:hypothetical protein PR048_000496 [Dryococelus australis]|uniref:DUF4371 domain-containing protein n=1 Tax=Dryococelus australis TaxID=614101 RepID=A0ABQ9IEV9_9NEOP|nr:hypothetical protein PR048_000496 [Dryococelus australis]